MNYFGPETAARRYSVGRPDFHSNTIARIKAYLHLTKNLENVLDIACGTGLSTRALLSIANCVYGTDASEEMLKHAPCHDNIQYMHAMAEQQPFDNKSFDMVTVASGVHWFDIDSFLAEANRLLKSRCWLVIYDNFFIAKMHGESGFSKWYSDIYLKKYPAPARNDNYSWANETLSSRNFNLVSVDEFNNTVSLTKQQLVLYFTTQSNIISAVEREGMTYQEVETWLGLELSAFFDDDDTVREIEFGNWIRYMQRTD